MEVLKYKVITSDKQYDKYCKTLEELVFSSPKSKATKDEIALLTLLIEKYDQDYNTFDMADPIALLKSLIKDQKMKAVDLAKLLHVSEGLVSDILHYKKGLSKDTIRILSEKFKLKHESFNRPYNLQVSLNSRLRNGRMKIRRTKRVSA